MKATKNHAAFTLAELLVALAIIVILTLLSIPAIRPIIEAKSIDNAANMIKAALMHARNTATARGEETAVWLASGSVYENGIVTCNLAAGSEAFEAIVEETEATVQGDWITATPSDAHTGSLLYHTTGGSGTEYVQFSFTIESGSGNLAVYAWWAARDNRYTNVHFKIQNRDRTGWHERYKDQSVQGEQWVLLDNFDFDAGTYLVQVTDKGGDSGKYAVADAIKVGGSVALPQLDWSKEFAVPGAGWPENKWKDCHVFIRNRVSENTYSSVLAKIAASGEDSITAEEEWSESLVNGSAYLITSGDPTQQSDQQFVLGSGVSGDLRWDPLPRNIMIHPKMITDGGGASSKTVFPITFKPTGRVATTETHMTIKVMAQDPNNPDRADDPNLWRFIRVFPNTGRAVAARSVDALPD